MMNFPIDKKINEKLFNNEFHCSTAFRLVNIVYNFYIIVYNVNHLCLQSTMITALLLQKQAHCVTGYTQLLPCKT